jgi:hypothetical protein
LVTAPAPPGTWGYGVPGELNLLPGTAHSYRLCVSQPRHQSHKLEEFTPSRADRSFLLAGSTAAFFACLSADFPIQVSQAKKMKRGLYVYQA